MVCLADIGSRRTWEKSSSEALLNLVNLDTDATVQRDNVDYNYGVQAESLESRQLIR